MESSGVAPRVGLAPADLVELVGRPGPFATVYLTTQQDAANQAQLAVSRWKPLRQSLADQGADVATLEAIDAVVPDAHREGEGLCVVAAPGEVLLVEHLEVAPRQDLARWGAVPALVPLLELRQSRPPHVVVLADREGADLIAVRHGREDVQQEAGNVAPQPIRKVNAGGWSQRRYQERAENAWEKNASAVVEVLHRMAQRVEARLVVVAGDTRAVERLQDDLPVDLRDKVHVVDGQRADGVDADRIWHDVDRAVHTAVAADTVALLEKWREERGQQDRAVDGAEATLAALSQGQVDTLLVHDDADDERVAYVGADPVPVSLDAGDLTALGYDDPQPVRLVDAAVRAALGTGASVRVVPRSGNAREGVGGVLRWSR